jgi:hypothetical protein
MLSKLLIAWCLMAGCVAVHAGGVVSALRLWALPSGPSNRFWPWTWLFIRVAGWIILFHLFEIAIWAWFYAWKEAMPDFPTALYFSAVTYTTTGYGDHVLPSQWRLVGGVEALTGILMCGWSTGFFFALANRLLEGSSRPTEPGAASTPTHP